MKIETAEALAEELVACPEFHWMPGMLGQVRGGFDRLESAIRVTHANAPISTGPNGWLPDLRDDATLGCLLHLVRKKHGRLVVVRWACVPDWWEVFTHHRGFNEGPSHLAVGKGGPTEAEALVRALQASTEDRQKIWPLPGTGYAARLPLEDADAAAMMLRMYAATLEDKAGAGAKIAADRARGLAAIISNQLEPVEVES
jgi:hypothetical protein